MCLKGVYISTLQIKVIRTLKLIWSAWSSDKNTENHLCIDLLSTTEQTVSKIYVL